VSRLPHPDGEGAPSTRDISPTCRRPRSSFFVRFVGGMQKFCVTAASTSITPTLLHRQTKQLLRKVAGPPVLRTNPRLPADFGDA
jgi:hypothetical protein